MMADASEDMMHRVSVLTYTYHEIPKTTPIPVF